MRINQVVKSFNNGDLQEVPFQYSFCPVAHLALKEGVCYGRAAFDITFQHKLHFL